VGTPAFPALAGGDTRVPSFGGRGHPRSQRVRAVRTHIRQGSPGRR
jgi:hypothetical protein